MSLQTYIDNYRQQISSKPSDSGLEDQVAKVELDGEVHVQFTSSDIIQIRALRDWLTSLLS